MKIPISAGTEEFVIVEITFPQTHEVVKIRVHQNGDVVVFGKLHIPRLDAFGRSYHDVPKRPATEPPPERPRKLNEPLHGTHERWLTGCRCWECAAARNWWEQNG